MSTSNAFLVEHLRVMGGWRQSDQLYFRYRDAERVATGLLKDKLVRSVRVRRVVIDAEPLLETEQTYEEAAS